MKCKNCIYYNSENGYKYGECKKIVQKTEEKMGLKLNPDRIYDEKSKRWRDGDYVKPAYIPDPNSNIYLDDIIWESGTYCDAPLVGEHFGCIHFKEI
jgi:hypothetical protein